MAEFYAWFVFAHLAGLVVFAISHGASAFMAFRLRSAPDAAAARALLSLGQLSIAPMYIGLLLLIVGGLGAAFAGDLWGRPWLIASVVVFIVVLLVAAAEPVAVGQVRLHRARAHTGRVPALVAQLHLAARRRSPGRRCSR